MVCVVWCGVMCGGVVCVCGVSGGVVCSVCGHVVKCGVVVCDGDRVYILF